MDTSLTRRDVLKAGSCGIGLGLTGSLAGCRSTETAPAITTGGPTKYYFDNIFPRYTDYDPLVPVWCVTPDIGRVIHRFHLSSSISPSGRYLGLTRLAREDSRPTPGEVAEIVLVDLKKGGAKIIAETRGWDSQMGAHVQWGATDEQLFYNDIDTSTWIPYGIVMNPLTGAKRKLDWTVYDVSPDGRWVVSCCLRRISKTQGGYGVVIPPEAMPENKGLVDDDGLYVTNVRTGRTKMIASLKKIVTEAIPKIDVTRYGPGDFYGFHVKWNPKNDRIMLVLRYIPYSDNKYKPHLITMQSDGSDIRMAIPATLWGDRGGNHPNWHPDGEHVMMNLDIYGDGWRFVQARYDGSDLKTMTEVPGNHGHPSVHPDGRFILTDAYPREDIAWEGDETAPLMLIDLEKDTRTRLVRMNTFTHFFTGTGENPKYMRVDLHPAWDSRTHTLVAFNGVAGGTRRVFIADLSELVPAAT